MSSLWQTFFSHVAWVQSVKGEHNAHVRYPVDGVRGNHHPDMAERRARRNQEVEDMFVKIDRTLDDMEKELRHINKMADARNYSVHFLAAKTNVKGPRELGAQANQCVSRISSR